MPISASGGNFVATSRGLLRDQIVLGAYGPAPRPPSSVQAWAWPKPATRARGRIRVSSTEFGTEVSRYQDMALDQPVIVTRNGRDRTVMISADEYTRLKRRDRQVFAVGELPDDIIDAVRTSDMDERHRHRDDLIPDWKP